MPLDKRIISYISLGSNFSNPEEEISLALSAIRQLENSAVIKIAPLYQTRAIGPGEQLDYINTVVQIETQLTAQALLKKLHIIENDQGRKRVVKWGARSLDLDILLYGDAIINSNELQIPHPYLSKRNFVIYPLHYLASNLKLPRQLGTLLGLFLSSSEKNIKLL